MITAKELFDKMLSENDECTSTEMMIEFAKMHVTEALKQASEKAEAPYYISPTRTVSALVEKDTILNAYSLDNVV